MISKSIIWLFFTIFIVSCVQKGGLSTFIDTDHTSNPYEYELLCNGTPYDPLISSCCKNPEGGDETLYNPSNGEKCCIKLSDWHYGDGGVFGSSGFALVYDSNKKMCCGSNTPTADLDYLTV